MEPGWMRHHAIVVTGDMSRGPLHDARDKARALGCSVSEIVPGTANGYGSFLVAPDGSKEGWPASERGNEQRGLFIEWLRAQEGRMMQGPLDWAELILGDENGPAHVTRSSDEEGRFPAEGDPFPDDDEDESPATAAPALITHSVTFGGRAFKYGEPIVITTQVTTAE